MDSKTGSKEAAHTPGPWVLEGSTRGAAFQVVEPTAGTIVARLEFDPSDREALLTAEADARLIAAAPDLLAACEAALGTCEAAHEQWHQTETCACVVLRAAIAKARGES